MVEAAGVEPASENDPREASTCLSSPANSRRRASDEADDPAASPRSFASYARTSSEASRFCVVPGARHRRGRLLDVTGF